MTTTEKRMAFLFALVIPALLAGCKPRPALLSTAETRERDANNPFVGLWEWEANGRNTNNERYFYKFTDKYRWEYYVVIDDAFIDYRHRPVGNYTYKGSVLYMMSLASGGFMGVVTYRKGKLEGGALKFGKSTFRPVSADSLEINQGREAKLND
ncbi:MAG: hypothetical protein LBB40_05610 [Holophagales bacterium]|jgi:hypothetical protein|nr:hypothetical protein [Holophagales bacterium]